MRFNSVRTGNYSQSAKAVVRASDQIFDAAMSGKPDFTNISKEAIKGRSLERRAVTKAEGDVAKAGIVATGRAKLAQEDAKLTREAGERKGKRARMAGVLGGLGALAGGYVLGEGNKKDKAAHDEYIKKFDERSQAINDRLSQPYPTPEEIPDAIKFTPPKLKSFDQPSGGGESVDLSSESGGKSQSIGAISSTLTGNHKIIADAIAGPESGQWGYEAFNQGGEKGGTAVPAGFKRGSYKDHFGTSLTSKTIGEILELQRDPGRGAISDSDWVKSGKLHAVGRYQFIGSTLKDEVSHMGLDHNTKFTPAVQDKIFLSHLKRVGDISPWVGPMTKYSSEKRNYLNSLIPNL